MANPNITNGTCYAAPGHPLDDGFLPCGNVALGHVACCWQGDFCLVDSACFGVHGDSYVTYLAGCTDETYGGWNASNTSAVAAPCPAKGAAALAAADAWVGLAYCNGASDQWEACRQPDRPTTLTTAGPCACPTATADRTIGVADGATLAARASLPLSLGASIAWSSGYAPASSTSGTASTSPTGSIVASGSTASTAASSTTTAAASSTASSTASHTAVIAGVCAGVGGALLLLAAALLMCRRRRRYPPSAQPLVAPDCSKTPPIVQTASPHLPDLPEMQSPAPVSELESRPARPWSLRSELEDSVSLISPVRSSIGPMSAMFTGNTVGTIGTVGTTGTAGTAGTMGTGIAETAEPLHEVAELEA